MTEIRLSPDVPLRRVSLSDRSPHADCGSGQANGERRSRAEAAEHCGRRLKAPRQDRRADQDDAGDVADILEFQVAMLEDDALADPAYEVISAGIAADHAWRMALDVEIEGYRDAEDEYFRARAADMTSTSTACWRILSGMDAVTRITGGSIVAADDITPFTFLAADWSHGGAIALAGGSPSWHVAMLARARGRPGRRARSAVVEGAATSVGAGWRWQHRERDLIDDLRRILFEQRMAAANAALAAAEAASLAPAYTADGRRIAVVAQHRRP